MKRMRYVAGAVGIAAPALALGMPMAATAQTTTHSPKAGKSVSLAPVQAHENGRHPDFVCISASGTSDKKGIFLGEGFWSGHCLKRVAGILSTRQGGLEMRTRMYHKPASVSHPFKTTYVHGHFSQDFTVFSTSPSQKSVGQVWLALVNSKDLSSVKYGPVPMNAP